MKGLTISIFYFFIVTCSCLSLERIPQTWETEITTPLPSVENTGIELSTTEQSANLFQSSQTEISPIERTMQEDKDEPMTTLLPELSTPIFTKFLPDEGNCQSGRDSWSDDNCTERAETIVPSGMSYPLYIELDVGGNKSHNNTKRQTGDLSRSSLPQPPRVPSLPRPPSPPEHLPQLESSEEEKDSTREEEEERFSIPKLLKTKFQKVAGFPKKIIGQVREKVKKTGERISKIKNHFGSIFASNDSAKSVA